MNRLTLAGVTPVIGAAPVGTLSASGDASTASDARHGPYPMGLMAVLATVAMLFASFTAAVLIRRSGADWVPVTLPSIVWANAAVILLSSALVEVARASLKRTDRAFTPTWLIAAGALGLLFLAGQVVTWMRLIEQGVFLPSSPHASFFYMLSAIHGAHVIGGLGALLWTTNRAFKGAYTASAHTGLTHAAIFWHFVGALWIYLLILLSVA